MLPLKKACLDVTTEIYGSVIMDQFPKIELKCILLR